MAVVNTQNGWMLEHPLEGLINGMKYGQQLRMDLQRAADEHQAFLTNQMIHNREMNTRDIMERQQFQMLGRPVTTGTVQDQLLGTPVSQAEVPAPEPNAPPSLQNLPETQTQIGGAALGGVPYVRPVDKSRLIKRKDLQGQEQQVELYTPEEQLKRRVQMMGTEELYKALSAAQTAETVKQQYGEMLSPQAAAEFPGLAKERMSAAERMILERAAVTQKQAREKAIVKPAGSEIWQNVPGATPGIQPGAAPGIQSPGAPVTQTAVPGAPALPDHPVVNYMRKIAGATPPAKPGVDVPFPAPVIEQRRQEELSKERAKADPFGLFAGTTGAATAGAPAAGTTPTPLAQAIATFEGFGKPGSVAQTNNNPGNLRAGPGQTGTDKNGYAIFPDLNTGWAALHDLIQKRSTDNLTLQEFFGGKKGVYPGYAPAADRNDPANYASTVARQLGVDPTAKLADIPGSQLPAMATPGGRITPDMQGQAVLDALPRPLAQQVKAMSEGRMALPSSFALKTPYWQQMLGLVGQYDPSFDVNNPGKRLATAKDFASGKSAQQVNALNTVIGHLDSFSQAADKLNNSSFPLYNSLSNWISTNTGHPAVTNFETNRKAVVDELTRVWRGTGGSEKDIEAWSKSLDATNSPEQLHGAIAKIGELLESKLSALDDQYREGMGTIAQGRKMITPQARKTLDKLEAKAGGKPAAGVNPNPSGYVPGHVYGGLTYLGGDPNSRASWK